MKKKIFNSKSEKDTSDFAVSIAKLVGSSSLICLYGEMGTGKTTFVKSFAKALGVETRIISPTFVLVRSHSTKDMKKFYHIDAYRIDVGKDLHEIKEILEKDNVIIVIEWAEKIKSILPKKRIDIEFIYKKENEREIRFKQNF